MNVIDGWRDTNADAAVAACLFFLLLGTIACGIAWVWNRIQTRNDRQNNPK